MDKSSNPRPTYEDAGFNAFLRRSISSNLENDTLRQMARNSSSVSSINFDEMQVSGSLGDYIDVGRITIDGAGGKINFRDGDSNIVGVAGDLSDV